MSTATASKPAWPRFSERRGDPEAVATCVTRSPQKLRPRPGALAGAVMKRRVAANTTRRDASIAVVTQSSPIDGR
jgi:hypothetical protein